VYRHIKQNDRHSLAPGILILLLLSVLPGCGSDRAETALVTGRVTIDGRPVTEGRITFYPGKGRSATGSLAADGTYSLTTWEEGDGAVLGKHQVTIKATHSSGAAPSSFEQELQGGGPAAASIEWLVPPTFAQRTTTPLSEEVVEGANTIDFELKSEAK
jgi:hypothetical protein